MTLSPALLTPTASLMSSLKLRKKSLPIRPVFRRYSLMSGTATSPLRCQKYTATMRNQVMTKSEIESNISHLHAHLAEAPDLSEADKVALRNEIGDLQDKLALLEFRQENEDIDYGYHAQYDF